MNPTKSLMIQHNPSQYVSTQTYRRNQKGRELPGMINIHSVSVYIVIYLLAKIVKKIQALSLCCWGLERAYYLPTY